MGTYNTLTYRLYFNNFKQLIMKDILIKADKVEAFIASLDQLPMPRICKAKIQEFFDEYQEPKEKTLPETIVKDVPPAVE